MARMSIVLRQVPSRLRRPNSSEVCRPHCGRSHRLWHWPHPASISPATLPASSNRDRRRCGQGCRTGGCGRKDPCCLELLTVLPDRCLTTGFDPRDDREAIIDRCAGDIGPYLPCSNLKYPSFGMVIAARLDQSPSPVVMSASVSSGVARINSGFGERHQHRRECEAAVPAGRPLSSISGAYGLLRSNRNQRDIEQDCEEYRRQRRNSWCRQLAQTRPGYRKPTRGGTHAAISAAMLHLRACFCQCPLAQSNLCIPARVAAHVLYVQQFCRVLAPTSLCACFEPHP